MALERVVIVGAGQGGFEAAAALRREGYEGSVVLIGDEPGLPYQRPPLSKGYMADGRAERLALKPAAFYEKNAIERIEQVRAARIERDARAVVLEDGRRFGYDHLVLATGARNAVPPIAGADAPGVLGLRTLADADLLRERMGRIGHALVIGGGFIGLEFAAVARAAGADVTVVEAAERLMARVVSPPISAAFAAAHRAAGTEILTGVAVAAVREAGGVPAGVRLADGREIAGDTVLLATGVVPNVELAAEAGLGVENGIAVDAALLTDDPAISAIGDCASVPRADGAGRVRLESVQAATDHARFVAKRLMGHSDAYDAVPWFWSDQGDLKLQIAGLTAGADDLTAVEGAPPKFAVWCFAGGRLAGVETVNEPATHMAARRLLAAGGLTRAEVEAQGFDARALAKALPR